MRIALGIEYDGANFCGWQRQDNGPSIQACVEEAIGRVAAHPVTVICAGRTDAGVHGLHQVIHVDVAVTRPDRAWVFGGNVNLPPEINVLWAKPVAEDFHARFSALTRRYRYVIRNHRVRSALWAKRTAWEFRPLAIEKMQEAAQYLLGEHDFNAFRAQDCQAKSSVRTLHELTVRQHHEFILLDVKANGFLKQMVRNLAGVLMAVGMGKAPPKWAHEVLISADRRQGGVTAPPGGLYFCGAQYPTRYQIPQPSIHLFE